MSELELVLILEDCELLLGRLSLFFILCDELVCSAFSLSLLPLPQAVKVAKAHKKITETVAYLLILTNIFSINFSYSLAIIANYYIYFTIFENAPIS
jgi:hypothetical protein